jgi:glycosyltransferase involved in cell wall biosynthesis
MVIGKVDKGRGFEAALETFARIRRDVMNAKLLIVGHGPLRPALEDLSRSLSIEADVIWAGYHEDDLAEHFRAADILLFTAQGSDEGHRAVLEAMACATVPATYPIPGVSSLLADDSLIASVATPDSLAAVATRLLRGDLVPLRHRVVERSHEFRYAKAAQRLIQVYEEVV